MEPETKISGEYVYKGRAVNLRKDIVRTVDGREAARDIVEHDECIVVVAVDDKERILLVRQYRYAIGKTLLELPAGGIDGDETPEEAVLREMQEETGFLPKTITKIGGFYSAPGFCTEYLHLYLAADLVPERLVAEDTAGITLERIDADQISGLIRSGKICDAKSIAGLYAWLDFRNSH